MENTILLYIIKSLLLAHLFNSCQNELNFQTEQKTLSTKNDVYT